MQYSFYKQNKRKIGAKGKTVAFFTSVLALFAFFAMYVHFVATPLIERESRAELLVYLTKSMNLAIANAMEGNLSYDDLVNISFDDGGNVKMITSNANKINAISMLVENDTLKNMQNMCCQPISIPLGSFFGISLFSGMGPMVSFDVYPRGEVECKFLSQFVSAGINQTHHKIYVDVFATINVVLPIKTIAVSMTSEVMVCESIIIGDVPDTYLCGSLSEMVN